MTWDSLKPLPRALCPLYTLSGQLHTSCSLQLLLAYSMLPVIPTPTSVSPGTSSTAGVASEGVLSTDRVVPEQWPLCLAEELNDCLAMLMWPRRASGSDLRFSQNEKLWGEARPGKAYNFNCWPHGCCYHDQADGSGRASEEQVGAQNCARSLAKTTRATTFEKGCPSPRVLPRLEN